MWNGKEERGENYMRRVLVACLLPLLPLLLLSVYQLIIWLVLPTAGVFSSQHSSAIESSVQR